MKSAEIDWSLAPASANAWKMTEFGAVWLEVVSLDVTSIHDADPSAGIGYGVVGDPAPTFGLTGNVLVFRPCP